MRLAIAAPCLVLSLAAATAAGADDARKAIEAANLKIAELTRRGDGAGIAALYTENATMLPSGAPKQEGRKAVEEYWKKSLAEGIQDVKLTTEEVVPAGEDLAYEIGAYSMTVRPEGKEARKVAGKYVVIWKRAGGAWRLHVDTWNENGAAP